MSLTDDPGQLNLVPGEPNKPIEAEIRIKTSWLFIAISSEAAAV